MTTDVGSAASPQASRQVRHSRSSRWRQWPSRVLRENWVSSVLNGISQSWPMARNWMSQKQRHQIALCSAAPLSAGFGPDRVGFALSPSVAASSITTSSTKASTSAKARGSPSRTCARNANASSVYRVAHSLLAQGLLDDALYDEGMAVLGECGMVDLVAILGYYCMVALTLNAFRIGLPGSYAAELDADGKEDLGIGIIGKEKT
jgi:hypothetical protein